ncbi:MAG: Do family serine endopeptidase [Opitutales bacterium]
MKTKLFAVLLGLGAIGLLFGAEAKKKEKTEFRQPELKLDTSALNEGKAPVLTSYADVLEGVRPSVVSVYSSKIVREQVPQLYRQLFGPNVRGREQKLEGLGSGVIVSTDGYILTNNHVVAEADELKVALNDGREFIAKVVGTDPKTDVAIIKIDAGKLPAITIADSSRTRVGDVVFAIGNPLGVGQTVTMGIISATGRRVGILDEVAGYEDFIQTDASINRGNSGGALVDAKGRLVGINSAIVSNNEGSIGIGFAVPVNLARTVMTSLIATGTVSRGYLGVETNPEPLNGDMAESLNLPRDTKGVLITGVNPKGPAAKAGLKQNDVILAVNDKPVGSRDDLRLFIAESAPGAKVTLKVLRDGKELGLMATLDPLPEEIASNGELLPGVQVQPLSNDLRQQLDIDERINGIVVTDIKQGSSYETQFPQGAVIETINRRAVTDLASAKEALREGRNIALVYYRGVRRFIIFVAP